MKQFTLVYDDHCPLCACYTSAFVKYGFLKPDERKSFSTADEHTLSLIEFEKGKDEIPLINGETGEVLYGIDALLEILGMRYRWIRRWGRHRLCYRPLRILYKLVSFNRKVIVARKCGPGEIDCTPAFHLTYRSVFLLLSLLFNTLMLFPIHSRLLSTLPAYHLSVYQLQWAHLALIVANIACAFTLSTKKAYEYLGQVNMLALTTTLLFVPLLLVAVWTRIPAWILVPYLAILTIRLFYAYIRRMHYAGMLLQHSWIAALNLAGIAAFILYLFKP